MHILVSKNIHFDIHKSEKAIYYKVIDVIKIKKSIEKIRLDR